MEEILALIWGLLAGTISGLVPGIHSNTIAQFFEAMVNDPILLGIAVVAATSVYTVLSLLPAIFLCIPESSTVLSILPGQRMLKEGKGLHAVEICAFSALAALLVSLILLPSFFVIIPGVYSMVRPVMAPVLTLICVALILQEKEIDKVAKALFIFALAGAFGFILLSNPILKEPLFTVFIGLFALSNLATTMQNTTIPPQSAPRGFKLSELVSNILPIVVVGVLLGSVADIFPALNSSAQIATFGSILTGTDPGKFLAMTMSISVSHIFSSMTSLYTIGKARTGSVAVIRENQAMPDLNTLILYFIVAAISIAISVILLLFFSRYFIMIINKVNLRILNMMIMLYLVAVVLLVDGFPGLFVTAVATALGALPIMLGIRRTQLMGFLLVPALIYLW